MLANESNTQRETLIHSNQKDNAMSCNSQFLSCSLDKEIIVEYNICWRNKEMTLMVIHH